MTRSVSRAALAIFVPSLAATPVHAFVYAIASTIFLAVYAALLARLHFAPGLPWIVAAVFVAAFSSSIAGFAFPAICGAILFHLIHDPVHVVEILMVCGIGGQALMVWSLRREIAWHSLPPFLAGAAVGLPLGVRILMTCNPAFYMRAFGSLLIVYAIFRIFRRPATVHRHHLFWDVIAGSLGGITGGAAALPSPFVIIWCGYKGWTKERQRGVYQPFILIVQLAGIGVVSLSSAAGTHHGTFEWVAIAYLPAMLLGVSCGMACFRWMNDRQFGLWVNMLLAISGVSLAV